MVQLNVITAPVSKRSGIVTLAACGLAALVLTTLVSAMWGTLVATNLRTNPGVPWASLVMAVVLWLLWLYAGGRWPPKGTAHARQVSLRARPVSGRSRLPTRPTAPPTVPRWSGTRRRPPRATPGRAAAPAPGVEGPEDEAEGAFPKIFDIKVLSMFMSRSYAD